MTLKNIHSHPKQLDTSFEVGLFHPIAVDAGVISWMAKERQKIHASLPKDHAVEIVTLRGLSDKEYKGLPGDDRFDQLVPLESTGSNMGLYRQLKANPPRFPVYLLKKSDDLDLLEAREDVGMDGFFRQIDMNAHTFNPGDNMLPLMWAQIGVIHGVHQPTLGFIRSSTDSTLLHSIQPRTASLKEHTLMRGDSEDEKIGRGLADLLIRTADKLIKPRGGCNPENICAAPDGRFYFRHVLFQAEKTPQKSMDFMLYHMGRSSLRFLDEEGVFSERTAHSFLDRIHAKGLLNEDVLTDTNVSGFFTWEPPKKRHPELPPTL